MDIGKFFKRTIILYVLLMLAILLMEIVMPSYEIDENAPIPLIDKLSILFMIAWFYNMYLLFKFKPLGRTIFVPVQVLSFVLVLGMPLETLVPSNYFSYFVGSIFSILTGVILTLIYFPDIKSKFEEVTEHGDNPLSELRENNKIRKLPKLVKYMLIALASIFLIFWLFFST